MVGQTKVVQGATQKFCVDELHVNNSMYKWRYFFIAYNEVPDHCDHSKQASTSIFVMSYQNEIYSCDAFRTTLLLSSLRRTVRAAFEDESFFFWGRKILFVRLKSFHFHLERHQLFFLSRLLRPLLR